MSFSNLQSCLMWVTERPYTCRARRSPCFRMFGGEWYLSLDLMHSESETYICTVYMYRCNDGFETLERELSVQCHVISGSVAFSGSAHIYKIKEKDHLILRSRQKRQVLAPSDDMCDWIIFCRFSSRKPLSLHINNETISIPGDSTNVDECVQVSSEIPHDMEALSSDISSLLEEDILPDFKLNCGDRSFPVHRSVLAARSEVFRTMFRSRMKESETGSADIKDLEVPVLQSMLKFLYSGKLENFSEDTAASLYAAADKYSVPSLRKACSYWMERNLSEDNCISYLSIADSHSDPDLTAHIVSFIVRHPGVFNGAAWLKFSEQQAVLANRVFQAYFSPVTQ